MDSPLAKPLPKLLEYLQHRDDACFHCGLPLPPDLDLSLSIDGADRALLTQGTTAW